MASSTSRLGFGALVMAALLAASASATAHTRWITPPPRSNADNLKPPAAPGPCGNVARTNKVTTYASGATINVKWEETIGHVGCYQVVFSPDDVNWVTLKQIADPAGGNVMISETVKLPAGVSCDKCTLGLRQIMLDGLGNTACAADAAPPNGTGGNGNTYFSCADICVGTSCSDAGAPTVPDAGGNPTTPGKDSGGPTTVPTDGGGKFVDASDDDETPGAPNLRSGEGDGCSVTALGATSGLSFGVAAGLFGLALLRRRRNRG